MLANNDRSPAPSPWSPPRVGVTPVATPSPTAVGECSAAPWQLPTAPWLRSAAREHGATAAGLALVGVLLIASLAVALWRPADAAPEAELAASKPTRPGSNAPPAPWQGEVPRFVAPVVETPDEGPLAADSAPLVARDFPRDLAPRPATPEVEAAALAALEQPPASLFDDFPFDDDENDRLAPRADEPAGSDSAAAARIALPSEAARGAALLELRSRYGLEWTAPKSPVELRAWSARLRKAGVRDSEEPAVRFVALEAARDAAAEAGDLEQALAAVDSLAESFAIEGLAMKSTLLVALLQRPARERDDPTLWNSGLELLDQAVREDALAAGIVLADTLLAAARKSGSAELVAELQSRGRSLRALAEQFPGLASAQAVLKSTPTDAAASGLVGAYLCLAKGDWQAGLPLLARGDNPALKVLAGEDLDGPDEPREQLALADRWLRYAEGAPLNQRSGWGGRAQEWFAAALPALPVAEQAAVLRRLAQFEEAGGAHPLAIAPFSPDEAKRLQTAAARRLAIPPRPTNSLGVKLALIPAGWYRRGSSADEPSREANEGPQHLVQIRQAFYLSTHEVTVAQFAAFVSASGYGASMPEKKPPGPPGLRFRGRGEKEEKGDEKERAAGPNWRSPGYTQAANSPVVYVSWDDAVAFCEWLSRQENRRYRLPTEAEWEYACRCGSETRFYGGDESAGAAVGFFNVNSTGTPRPVGSRGANAWGLADLHGNVWEWCGDWYGEYTAEIQVDPTGPSSGQVRVVRGGAADSPPTGSAHRERLASSARVRNVGFRVVCEVAEQP